MTNRFSCGLAILLSLLVRAPTTVAQQTTVIAWGTNYCGQFGSSTLPEDFTGVIAVSAGGLHSLALKANGTVEGWCNNDFGQSLAPVGLTGVVAVSAGGDHSLALKSDGTVVSWGRQRFGPPETVPSDLNGVIAVAAGFSHSLALRQDGTVVAWGDNSFGQSQVPTNLTGVIAIAAGEYHSLALKRDGTVVSWGGEPFALQTVPSGLRGVVAVSAGISHSLALKQDGTVVAWGNNSVGQLNVPADLTGVTAISAGGDHSLALKQDGTVVGWGNEQLAELAVPHQIAGVIGIAAGGSSSFFDFSLALVYTGPMLLTMQTQPQTQTAEAGSAVRLRARVVGLPPLEYQWWFNGTNLLNGNTNSFLDLTNIQPSQSGTYSLIVSNRFGSTNTDAAFVNVISPIQRTTVPAIYLTGGLGSVLQVGYSDKIGVSAPTQVLAAVTITNNPQLYLDLSEPPPIARLYQAWQTNRPSSNPGLQMSLATEIPLTGAVGSRVRIDYIEVYGPTDAWVTLDTIALAQTTQPYFDVTMFRKPSRLYRVVPIP